MDVINYHRSYDAFQQGDIARWAIENRLDYVVEIHRNSSAGNGKGYETIINSKYMQIKLI